MKRMKTTVSLPKLTFKNSVIGIIPVPAKATMPNSDGQIMPQVVQPYNIPMKMPNIFMPSGVMQPICGQMMPKINMKKITIAACR